MMRPGVFSALAGVAVLAAACGGGPGPDQPPAVTPQTVDAPQAKPEKPRITTAQLLGQSAGWLEAKLGAPAFVRHDQHAHMWQYKNRECVLNVFLYEDDVAAHPRVAHFDARGPGGTNADRGACLAALQD
ncbi:MAG: hypothetical protein HQL36_06220 [Alphaproteobacteria bacterium]|nr:hypothetical protein [Alphaproteobacteria bacterium]MBF0250601.1 hypothetical protein [Alphaproteobacteria bacterium]